MKKTGILLLSVLLALALTGCGEKSKSVKGETYETGTMSAMVPEG